ncbi:MAG: type I restriction-modification system subunit M N-terminal domain-containing protein [Nitrososphaeraceae archaeon]
MSSRNKKKQQKPSEQVNYTLINPNKITFEFLKSYLWNAADILRGSLDPSDYRQPIMTLLFLKRLNDTFEENAEKLDKRTSNLFSKTIVEEGDLVLAVRGATIGKFALVPKALSGSNINANLLRIHLNKGICDPIYFWYYTQTNYGRSGFKKFVSYTAKETVQAGK